MTIGKTNRKVCFDETPRPARETSATRKVRCGNATKRKSPAPKAFGAGFWRRPTLARPFVALPSGLQRFTAVFGMGTGGATALLSPESDAGLAVRRFAARQADAELWWRDS